MSSPGLTGRSSIPETPVLEPIGRGVLDRPLSRTMTTEYVAGTYSSTILRPRDAIAPELCVISALRNSKRAQGMPGEGLTHGPRAVKKHGEGTTGSAESSGIPCAIGYGLYVVSSVTGLSCHRHSRSSRELSLSVGRPEPYDFAVRISAVRPHEKDRARRHCGHRIPPHVS